ncbi:MAG: hypothetical protein FJ293_07740 [Planctomycetes bacterium]|nr:hypothetical protein [Planctomycetota bacterium]
MFDALEVLTSAIVGLAGAPQAAAPAAPLTADVLLDPAHLVEVRITMKPDDWDALRQQRRHGASFFAGAPIDDPFTWFPADVKIDGVVVRKVAVRKKGLFGSMDSERPSLKIKFDEYVEQDPIVGLDRLTLNNNKQDTSLVSQYLTYKLFRDAGLPAPRSNLARVTLNGENLGVYTHVESIRKPLLKRLFGDDDGNLYEGTLTDFHPRTLENFAATTNEKTTDRADLARIAALFEGEAPLDLAKVAESIDLDAFLRFVACEAIAQFWDGYSGNQNNFYFYVVPTTGKGSFLPWGADGNWSERRFRGPDSTTALYAKSILCNRIYHAPGMSDRYRDTLRSLLDGAFREADFNAEIDRLQKLARPHLHRAQKDTERAAHAVREFIAGRRAQLEGELARWPPRVATAPVLPTYTTRLGTLRGVFSAKWENDKPDDPSKLGKVDLELTLDGEPVAFKRIGVAAYEHKAQGFFGAAGAPPRVELAVAGVRATNGQLLSFEVSIDQAAFEAATAEAIPVTGNFRRGEPARAGREAAAGAGARGAGPRTSVFGDVRFIRAGVKRGQRVEGELDLTIAEVHGGGQ